MSRKKIDPESINTASHMNQNETYSNSKSESKKGNQNGDNSTNKSKKGNSKVENLANQLKKTGFNREKTPSPVKSKSKSKTQSPVKKKSGSSTKTNSSIPPKFSLGSALRSISGMSSGENITFSESNATPKPSPKKNTPPKKKPSPKKKTPSKTRTLETIPSGRNITFNSTKAKSGANSASSGVSKISIASTVVPNKSKSNKNEGLEYNSSIRNLKANINRLEKTWKRVGMPISTYRRQIANLQRRLGALENLKKQNKTPQKSKNTSLNTSSTSLRSYTSQEASVEKDRNRRQQQQTPSPVQTPQNMSINNRSRTLTPGSPMNHNGSRVGSVGSGSSRGRYNPERNASTRRNLSYNLSQVANLQAGENSREAEDNNNSKKKKKKDSKKKK